jgi:aminomethyltransferase
MDVTMTVHDDRGLLALQGPSAMPVLQKMTQFDLSKFYFGMFAKFDIKGVPCWVTRTG